MARHRLLVIAAVVVGLMGSACSPLELAEIFAVRDLSTNEDPVKVAAGDAAPALDADRSAQMLADEGLREKSIDKLAEAARARPRDPRYPAYAAAFQLAEGNRVAYEAWLREAAKITVSEQNAIIEGESLQRDSVKERQVKYNATLALYRSVIEGLDWALAIERGRDPEDPGRIDLLEKELCKQKDFYHKRFDPAPGGAPILLYVGGAECPEGS